MKSQMKFYLVFLLLSVFVTVSQADTAAMPIQSPGSSNELKSLFSAKPSGVCGVGDFIASPNVLNFDDSILVGGLRNLTFDEVKKRREDLKDISGFKCPSLKDIDDPTIPKDAVNEVTLANVNFSTGEYLCVYSFADTAGHYVLKRVNQGCLADTGAAYFLAGNPDKMPPYTLGNFYGLSTVNPGQDSIQSFGVTIKGLSKALATAIAINKEEKMKKATDTSVATTLNSHTNFSHTLPSIITGILTLDTNFFEDHIVSNTGALQLKDNSVITSISTSANIGQKIKNVDKKVTSLLAGLDKKMWGFYYYLLENISAAFKYIITLIFSIGTIGVFSYAFIRKSTDKQGSFDFNYTHKFIGIVSAIVIFSAPLVPTHKGLPGQFLYNPKTDNVSNKDADQLVAKNSIIIDSLLRYGFQEGTFWANTINDYAMYAYLKYFEVSSGIFDTKGLKDSFKEDASSILQGNILLKKKMNFFEKTCAYNYYSQLSLNYTLPDYNGGIDSGIKMFKDNPLGYNKVDYNTCAKIYKEIQEETVSNIEKYDTFYAKYSNVQTIMKKIDSQTQDRIAKTEEKIVAINNKLGWLSVVLLPNLNYILQAKGIFSSIQAYNSSNDFKKSNEKITKAIGSMQFDRDTLFTQRPKVQVDFKSGVSRLNNQLDRNSNYDVKGLQEKTAWDGFWNFFINKLSIGEGLGWIGSNFIYFAYPGFSEMFQRIKDIVDKQSDSGKHIGMIRKFVGSVVGKIGGAITGMISLAKLIPGASLVTSLIMLIIVYYLTVALYVFMLTVLTLILTTSLLIIKIIYYFIEILIAVFVSKAVILWSLVFDKQKAMSSIQEFAYKIMLLVFAPIAIELSVYAFMFAKSLMFYLYGLLMEFVYYVSDLLSPYGTYNIQGAFTSVVTYSVYNTGDMILKFLSIFIAFNIFFNFYDWMLNYFGHKGEMGISKSMNSVFDEIKQKTVSKV